MGNAYLGLEPIFVLETDLGRCELWSDELGYTLYVEWAVSYKPQVAYTYANRANAIDDAFQDAKNLLLLEEWKIDWYSICANETIDDWDEWNDFCVECGKALTKD